MSEDGGQQERGGLRSLFDRLRRKSTPEVKRPLTLEDIKAGDQLVVQLPKDKWPKYESVEFATIYDDSPGMPPLYGSRYVAELDVEVTQDRKDSVRIARDEWRNQQLRLDRADRRAQLNSQKYTGSDLMAPVGPRYSGWNDSELRLGEGAKIEVVKVEPKIEGERARGDKLIFKFSDGEASIFTGGGRSESNLHLLDIPIKDIIKVDGKPVDEYFKDQEFIIFVRDSSDLSSFQKP